MATPGVGTIVRLHYSAVDGDLSETIYGDLPAVVWATHDSWNSTLHDEWVVAQPSASTANPATTAATAKTPSAIR